MKKEINLSLLGSAIAFLVATSCCWLPFVAAIFLGGTVGLNAYLTKMEPVSGLFMAIGAGLFAFAAWQYFIKRKRRNMPIQVKLETTLTCPKCGFQKKEVMPTDACQYFYECQNCKELLKPLPGDCCVFCSYATEKCPPIQLGGNNCCSN